VQDRDNAQGVLDDSRPVGGDAHLLHRDQLRHLQVEKTRGEIKPDLGMSCTSSVGSLRIVLSSSELSSETDVVSLSE